MRYIKNYEEKINEEFKMPQFIRNYKETGDLIKDKVYKKIQKNLIYKKNRYYEK